MRAFADELQRTVAVATSNVRQWTVTVAVVTDRRDEAAILDSLTAHGRAIDFVPFRDSVDDLDLWESRDWAFCRRVVSENREGLTAVSRQWEVGQPPEHRRAETMHAAVLLVERFDDLDDAVALVAGDRGKARTIAAHTETLQGTVPNLLHCTQAQRYFPSTLLANVAAKYVAWALKRDRYDEARTVLPAPRVDEMPALGSLYASIHASEEPPRVARDVDWAVSAPNHRAESPEERLRCWFGGFACRDPDDADPVPESPTSADVRSYLVEEGHERLVADLPLGE